MTRPAKFTLIFVLGIFVILAGMVAWWLKHQIVYEEFTFANGSRIRVRPPLFWRPLPREYVGTFYTLEHEFGVEVEVRRTGFVYGCSADECGIAYFEKTRDKVIGYEIDKKTGKRTENSEELSFKKTPRGFALLEPGTNEWWEFVRKPEVETALIPQEIVGSYVNEKNKVRITNNSELIMVYPRSWFPTEFHAAIVKFEDNKGELLFINGPGQLLVKDRKGTLAVNDDDDGSVTIEYTINKAYDPKDPKKVKWQKRKITFTPEE